MKTTKEKAEFISNLDRKILHLGDEEILEDWENLILTTYKNAKGNEFGWIGIADEDPLVIEKLYLRVIKFAKENLDPANKIKKGENDES